MNPSRVCGVGKLDADRNHVTRGFAPNKARRLKADVTLFATVENRHSHLADDIDATLS
jgi:hypothetical protein